MSAARPGLAWPRSAGELERAQEALRRERPPPWRMPAGREVAVGGCFVCFAGEGAGERAWAGAALVVAGRLAGAATASSAVHERYRPGLLALRVGEALEAAARALAGAPDVLLVNATGSDHPRRAGLALHLGAVLDLPTVGVTHRPLVAEGTMPDAVRGASSPLRLGGDTVGYWVRTRAGARPLAVHAAWRTDAVSRRRSPCS